MIMILSSSTSSKFGGRKKQVVYKFENYKGNPLRGIESDKKRFQQRHPNSTVIESSQDKDALLSLKYIINILRNEFSRSNIYFFYIFYSGHGHTNGDLAPETTEKPQADRITLKELAGLWAKRKQKTAKLFIFMDSCYSGSWCHQMKSMNKDSIAIFASSQSHETSIDSSGGVFLTTILDPKENFAANYAKLMQHQKPVFFCSDSQVYPLTQNHLKSLNQKIQNALSIYEGGSYQNQRPQIPERPNYQYQQRPPQQNQPPVNNYQNEPSQSDQEEPQNSYHQRLQRQNELLEMCRRQAAKYEQTKEERQRRLLKNCQRQAEKVEKSRVQRQNDLLEWCKRQAAKYE